MFLTYVTCMGGGPFIPYDNSQNTKTDTQKVLEEYFMPA